jgi:Flp pilus assembly protein CpaB
MRGRLLILIGLIILLVAIVVVVVVLPGLNPAPAPVATLEGSNDQPSNPDATLAPTPTPVPIVQVVVALQNLPRGYRFPDTVEELANVVGFAPWPDFAVPFNAIQQIAEDPNRVLREQILGKIVRTDVSREQPILTTLLVDDLVNIANVGSDAAAVLPNDRVAVTIPVNRVTSVGYAIQDGDHVDVIISMLFVDVDEIFQSIQPNNITLFNIKENGEIEFVEGIAGRPDVTSLGPAIIGPSERQRPRLVTQRTIQDALVLHVGDFPLDGKFIGVPPTPTPVPVEDEETGQGTPPPPPTPIPAPDIVTLGVTPQYAVFLVWAIEAKLPLTLALRSATDTSRGQTQAVTLDYIMNEFRIDLPGRRDYTIEPAIRSIRQLLAGDEISLNPTP